MIRKWVWLSFLYLLIVGALGCLLRLVFFMPVGGVNFRYFLHAHSHVAFLGWVFNALFAALVFAYLPGKAKSYRLLFGLLQLAVLGMLFTFPLQGYAAASISFSTLHILLSYWFAGKFLKDTKDTAAGHPLSLSFVRWSLFFMILSSLGPFALGAIMARGLAGTDLYQLAIYFYLHFQYDGWFSFAVFGLFFRLLEINHVAFHAGHALRFLRLMAAACIPAYALSALWTHPPAWVYAIGQVAAAAQVAALVYLVLLLKSSKSGLLNIFDPRVSGLMKFAFTAFILKIVLQFASAFPAVADLAYGIRNFTIGYLHIVFLGFVTVFLIGWFARAKLLNLRHRPAKAGIVLFLLGFVLSEVLIFAQPALLASGWGAIPYGYQLLFLVSLLMPLGTGMILFASFKKKHCEQKKITLKNRPVRRTKLWKARSEMIVEGVSEVPDKNLPVT